ncbi:MAG: hypothetical protein ACYS3N_16940 [Planctomycetota bacterium]
MHYVISLLVYLLWQHHLSSLSEAYYAHGMEQLERLNKWSRRRALDPPPAPSISSEDLACAI